MNTTIPAAVPHLPQLLRDLADATDQDTAHKLAETWGGRRLYVPKQPTAKLVDVLGRAAAAWLCRTYGGARIMVPMGPTKRAARHSSRIAELIKADLSVTEIAALVGVSERTVERHRSRLLKVT